MVHRMLIVGWTMIYLAPEAAFLAFSLAASFCAFS